MALLKTADARIVTPLVSQTKWKRIRTAGQVAQRGDLSPNLVERAGEMFEKPFDPNDYLLTHATIIASVDAYRPPGAKTGSFVEDGFRVNRKFPDFRITPNTQKYINNNCFAPGTPITMADGTVRPIEKVKIGDQVLTHRGRPRRVTKVYRHDVDGDIAEVSVRGSNEHLFVTLDHPFFAFRANRHCVACGQPIHRKLKTISHLLGRHYCCKECYYRHRVTNSRLLTDKRGEFTPVKDLTTEDFASTPVIEEERQTDLTLGQARLIGLFVAEGYYERDSRKDNEKVGACWAFHQDETHSLARTVQRLMKSEFGVDCVVRSHQNDNGIHVTTKNCRKAAEFFSTYVLGSEAKEKHLHEDLLYAPTDIQIEILKGWFEGDGSAFATSSDFRVTSSTASQSLAYQMRILLQRCGIYPRLFHNVSEGRRRLIVDGNVRVVSDPNKECHTWTLSCGSCYVSELVQDTVYEESYNQAIGGNGGVQKSPDLRVLNGYCLQKFTGLDTVEYQGSVYNLETEEDHSYLAAGVAVHNCDSWTREVLLASYPTFIGAENYCEHVQLPELSKGRIIDAVARDVGESVYVDILIATDRKHEELIKAIENEHMSTLSMGCVIDGSICTKCGHWAADETEMCGHIKYAKGNVFYDEQGRTNIVAELCGHSSLDPHSGVQFVEASWVAAPAFTGAVLRNILEPSEASKETLRKAQEVLSTPPPQWSEDDRQKAAAHTYSLMADGPTAKAGTRVTPTAPTHTSFLVTDEKTSGWMDEEEGEEGEETEEQAHPLRELEDELAQHMVKRVKKRIQEDMQQEVTEDAIEEDSTAPNDNVVKEAKSKIYLAGVDSIVKTAASDAALINSLAAYNNQVGVRIPVPLYRAALHIGHTDKYASLTDFYGACKSALGRAPRKEETRILLKLGKLLSQRRSLESGTGSRQGGRNG